jgi:hypothetical protein
MVSLWEIVYINKDGWVLYHSKYCQYCLDIKKKLGLFKWSAMNKKECSNGGCPPQLKGYPTWLNTNTGEEWDGRGVFR